MTGTLGVKFTDKLKEEIIDILLFCIALVLSVGLSFREITDFKENFGALLQPYFLWPMILLYLGVVFLLAYRRKKHANVHFYHNVLGPLFLVYFGLRLVGYLFFPFGAQTFTFEWEHQFFSVDYAGFGWYERMAEWIQEMLAVSIIYVMFVYYPTFRNCRKQLLYFFLLSMILATSIALLASFFLDYEGYGYNLRLFLGNIDSSNMDMPLAPSHELKSFFLNRNVFGLFLAFAILSLCLLNLMKPNFLWTLGAMFFLFFHVLVFSRSTLMISGISILLMLFTTPLFHWKDKRWTSICNILLLLALTLVAILLLTALKETPLGKGVRLFIESFRDNETVVGRKLLMEAAIDIIQSSLYFVVFGFGKVPFYNIFLAYQQAHGGEMVASAHNAWISAIATTGIIGLVFVLILDSIVLWMILKNLSIRKYDVFITLGILGGALAVFGLYEMHMLFFTDSLANSPLFYYTSFLFPVFYYYDLVNDTVEMKRHVPQELVYPLE